jgi:hypothetical protein
MNRDELISARAEFHQLLVALSDEDLNKRSKNKGWTNGEILFHMVLGFLIVDMLLPLVKIFNRLPRVYSKLFAQILNFSTPVFNFCNALGARIGGRIFTRISLEKRFDGVINNLLKKSDRIKSNEWRLGMYYPDKWDGLFDEYMTIEKLFRYPVKHFRFHLKQLIINL